MHRIRWLNIIVKQLCKICASLIGNLVKLPQMNAFYLARYQFFLFTKILLFLSLLSLSARLLWLFVFFFLTDQCRDVLPECRQYAKRGMCNHASPFHTIQQIRKICPFSCGICNKWVNHLSTPSILPLLVFYVLLKLFKEML